MSIPATTGFIRLLLTGDVMLGRGLDQMFKTHVDPVLYEDYVKDARDYMQLAVDRNGPLPENPDHAYVWGDALSILDWFRPHFRIINLETSITAAGKPWPHKGINYRMHPANTGILKSGLVDCVSLANNHVLDWGYTGLKDTLETLALNNITYFGAGNDLAEAQKPAIFALPSSTSGRLLIFGIGSDTAGVPSSWEATPSRAGVFYTDSTLHDKTIGDLKKLVADHRRSADLVVVSVHFGSNWGWELEDKDRQFARRLISEVGVDVVHGHSSHHIRPIEVYEGKLITYGCGDLISDYEGIGHSSPWDPKSKFRDDLSLLYLVDLEPRTGRLVNLKLVPTRLKNFRLRIVEEESDESWLKNSIETQYAKRNLTVSSKQVSIGGKNVEYFELDLPGDQK